MGILLFAGLEAAASASRGPGVRFTTDVPGPGRTSPFVHAPSVAVLPSGEIALAWYEARHPRGRDAAILGLRGAPRAGRWSDPAVWASTPGLPDANPVLFRDPRNRLWLFYGTRLVGWAVAWVRHRRSADEGRSWDAPHTITRIPGYLPRAVPIVRADGGWVLPVYQEERGSRFLLSQDQGETWAWSSLVTSEPLNIQPTVVELAPGRLLALLRNRGLGHAWVTRSMDGGKTWEPPVPSSIRNPDASLALLRLRRGPLALVYNDSAVHRNALAIALSADGGQTWPAQVLLEGCGLDAAESPSYSAAAEGPDGTLHIVYAVGGRRIRYAAVEPEAVWTVGRPAQRCETPSPR
jgi:predicted neuraminidase